MDGVQFEVALVDTIQVVGYETRADVISSDSCVVMCSVMSKDSVSDLESHVKHLQNHRGNLNNFPIIFAINHVDVNADQYFDTLENIKHQIGGIIEKEKLLNTAILETSALKNINMEKIIVECVRRSRGTNYQILKHIVECEDQLLTSIKRLQKNKVNPRKRDCSIF